MKIDVDRCVNEGAASRGRSEPRIREETHAAVPAVVRASGWVPYKWELVVLLWFTFFLHQADRQIYGNLLPLIKSDLQLSDVQLGLVASVFTAVFGVCVLIGGYAGDVLRRKWIVLASLMIFSVATLLSGLSTGLLMLIVFRGLATGGGEAIYYPAASSLIAQFHHRSRATALGIHQTAIYVGLVASCVAGYVGEFYGCAIGVLCLWRLWRRAGRYLAVSHARHAAGRRGVSRIARPHSTWRSSARRAG